MGMMSEALSVFDAENETREPTSAHAAAHYHIRYRRYVVDGEEYGGIVSVSCEEAGCWDKKGEEEDQK